VGADVRSLAVEFDQEEARVERLRAETAARSSELKQIEKAGRKGGQHSLALKHQIDLLKLELDDAEKENRLRQRALRKFVLVRASGVDRQDGKFYLAEQMPPGAKSDGRKWRISRISDGRVRLVGGGEVVGEIPRGLPTVVFPKLDSDTLWLLLSSTFVITLVGFGEAISIGKAMAVKTGERIDPNRELIGQGLANIFGSLTQSYPVSGSFSRSAVNLAAGARTGMASVFTGVVVLATLLFFTPLLYHLPQAVLSAVIMMAVVGLFNVEAVRHIWQAQKHDGISAVVTFFATLAFAPHLDNGLLVGVGVCLILFLYRRMKPHVAILGRHPDGTLRDAKLHHLPTGSYVAAVRFDGSLYFANVSYFEDAILEAVAATPAAKYLLVVGDGINEIDASGEEVIRHLYQRLQEKRVSMVFSGLKHQVVTILQRTGLYAEMGERSFFRTEEAALDAVYKTAPDPSIDAEFRALSSLR
jgi:SulP family sulfate permease